MPKVFRAMFMQDGMLAVGIGSHMLGARVPSVTEPEKVADISPDAMGLVQPDTGGLSVARSLSDLLPHLIPKRLKPSEPDAVGSNSRYVWSMGEGEFADGAFAPHLFLRRKPARPDGKSQGLLEPDTVMSLEDYQSALADTRPRWALDEPTPNDG